MTRTGPPCRCKTAPLRRKTAAAAPLSCGVAHVGRFAPSAQTLLRLLGRSPVPGLFLRQRAGDVVSTKIESSTDSEGALPTSQVHTPTPSTAGNFSRRIAISLSAAAIKRLKVSSTASAAAAHGLLQPAIGTPSGRASTAWSVCRLRPALPTSWRSGPGMALFHIGPGKRVRRWLHFRVRDNA